MGKDLYEGSASARLVFDVADAALGYKISEVCFQGPEERLRDTRFAQPALLADSIACLAAALEGGVISARPAFMAGHSLGQYTALVAAGAMSLEAGLLLVQERARLMAEAAALSPSSMAAILGLDEDAVLAICQDSGAEVCNLNLPTQTVIGGDPAAVQRAMALAKERGATRALELNVSMASHTKQMQPAADRLRLAVAHAAIVAPEVPVVANTSAELLTTAAGVRAELPDQVAQPVLWHKSVTLMSKAGVNRFVEFGPSRVLTGLARRLIAGAELRNISSVLDLA